MYSILELPGPYLLREKTRSCSFTLPRLLMLNYQQQGTTLRKSVLALCVFPLKHNQSPFCSSKAVLFVWLLLVCFFFFFMYAWVHKQFWRFLLISIYASISLFIYSYVSEPNRMIESCSLFPCLAQNSCFHPLILSYMELNK